MRSLLNILNGIIYSNLFSFHFFLGATFLTIVFLYCMIFQPGLLVIPIYGNMVFGDLLIFITVSYFLLFCTICGLKKHLEEFFIFLPITTKFWAGAHVCFGLGLIYCYFIGLINGTIYSNMKIESLVFIILGMMTWFILRPKIILFRKKKVL